MLTLFAAKGTIAIATALLLEETETPYDLSVVDIGAGEQMSEAYLKINPKARVPALVTDHGILTETGAVLEYVAPPLVPDDPFAAAQVRSISHYLASTMHVNHAHNKRGHRWADDDGAKANMTEKVPRTMAESCAFMETQVKGPNIFGDHITIADPHFFTICQWLAGDGVDVSQFPKVKAFMKTYGARTAASRVRDKGLL